MALIRNAKSAWSAPVTLDFDEIWQARDGAVFLTTTEAPAPDDGLSMTLGDGVRLTAGATVRYRKTGETDALIAREIV